MATQAFTKTREERSFVVPCASSVRRSFDANLPSWLPVMPAADKQLRGGNHQGIYLAEALS